LHQIALEDKWHNVANEVSNRMSIAIAMFENLGFQSHFNSEEYRKQIDGQIKSFKDQLAQAYSDCAKFPDQRQVFFSSNHRFNLGAQPFKLSALCHKGKLYGFRQPCDYNRDATTLYKQDVPESRIFIGSKPIRLKPLMTIKKKTFGGTTWE